MCTYATFHDILRCDKNSQNLLKIPATIQNYFTLFPSAPPRGRIFLCTQGISGPLFLGLHTWLHTLGAERGPGVVYGQLGRRCAVPGAGVKFHAGGGWKIIFYYPIDKSMIITLCFRHGTRWKPDRKSGARIAARRIE